VVFTSYGLANPNASAFGPHNFADYTAIVILLPARRPGCCRFMPHIAACGNRMTVGSLAKVYGTARSVTRR